MIDPICWLHISDIHMKEDQAWSQDVVLTAMCRDIAHKRSEGFKFNFVLVSGDLAYSGSEKEYSLVMQFLDALSLASNVCNENIFCIPGNHDIERERQKMCFNGARQTLQSQSHVDSFFSSKEDVETLLIRLTNYTKFQKTYFPTQKRTYTNFEMAYVSNIDIGEIRLAIIAMNSAWLAEGGLQDHKKLLIGERQVIDAISLAEMSTPHIMVAMAHHPFHLLNDFDRKPVERKVESNCHFFHCGHLHDPEKRYGLHCVTLAAGASFETRYTHNSYSIITLNILTAKSNVKTVQYNPTEASFSSVTSEDFPHYMSSFKSCSISELAKAIQEYDQSLLSIAHYLSALLLNAKSEFAIPNTTGYVFGSFEVLQDQPDSDVKRKTIDFVSFQNVLKVLNTTKAPLEILRVHGDAVKHYGSTIFSLCRDNPSLRTRINEQEKDAINLADVEPLKTFHYTTVLLNELANEQEWVLLREMSERHMDSDDHTLSILSKRMRALSFAQSDNTSDRKIAIDQYISLVDSKDITAVDVGRLVTLLIDFNRFEEAQDMLCEGFNKFPEHKTAYNQIAQQIINVTGDRKLRKMIMGL